MGRRCRAFRDPDDCDQGQSTWTAPKGLRLGLPLAALEKLNGKPFKLIEFENGGMAIVGD